MRQPSRTTEQQKTPQEWHESFKRDAKDRYIWSLLNVLNCTPSPLAGVREDRRLFTAESQTKLTDFVVLVKRTVGGLALLPNLHQDGAKPDYRFANELRDINQILNDVVTVPALQLTWDARGLEAENHVRNDVNAVRRAGRWPALETGTNMNWIECEAALGVVELIRRSALDDLRRCDCGTWFIAVRSDQLSCSATCRQRRHAKTPEFKVKRRSYRKTKAEMAKLKEARDAKGHK